jgi:hypothetical protein
MTGHPQFNYPLFLSVAEELREKGWDIHNPVEMDDPDVRAAAMESPTGELDEDSRIAGHTWGQILGKDVTYLSDECDSIMLLPGWSKSRGARLEAYCAVNNGFSVYQYYMGVTTPVPGKRILELLKRQVNG